MADPGLAAHPLRRGGAGPVKTRENHAAGSWRPLHVHARGEPGTLNDLGVNSYHNFSARPNPDRSFAIHFDGDLKGVNDLPITKGWNYAVRMYQPRQGILDGSWTFPTMKAIP